MNDVYFGIDDVNILVALVDHQIELDRLFNNNERMVHLMVLRSKLTKL